MRAEGGESSAGRGGRDNGSDRVGQWTLMKLAPRWNSPRNCGDIASSERWEPAGTCAYLGRMRGAM